MSEIIENQASVVKFRISLYFAQVIGLLRIVKLAENNTFLSRSYVKTQRRLLMKHKHNTNTL